jgi:hypothetical protein
MSSPDRLSVGIWLQITQPPKGSFSGTPSSVTSVRPAPDGAMARSEMPWVVGLAARLEVRRNRLTAGTDLKASSSRVSRDRRSSPMRTTLNAASLAAGGRRAAVTTMSGRSAGVSWIMPGL